jgi:hypothetical protein
VELKTIGNYEAGIMPTLVMMHGMTGTADMMRPFAEKILPDGWDLVVPEADFEHLSRGFTWWRYEGGDQPGRRMLSATELSDVDSSLLKLSNLKNYCSLSIVFWELLLWVPEWLGRSNCAKGCKRFLLQNCCGCTVKLTTV